LTILNAQNRDLWHRDNWRGIEHCGDPEDRNVSNHSEDRFGRLTHSGMRGGESFANEFGFFKPREPMISIGYQLASPDNLQDEFEECHLIRRNAGSDSDGKRIVNEPRPS
jgi:hypothetical protein